MGMERDKPTFSLRLRSSWRAKASDEVVAYPVPMPALRERDGIPEALAIFSPSLADSMPNWALFTSGMDWRAELYTESDEGMGSLTCSSLISGKSNRKSYPASNSSNCFKSRMLLSRVFCAATSWYLSEAYCDCIWA